MGNILAIPSRAYLTWRNEPHATHYVVGELARLGNSRYCFKYSAGSDLDEARKRGFKGHPAFKLNLKQKYTKNALEVFAARLPGRNRGDFKDFLGYWEIDNPDIDEFALIAITGARLATDSFEFIAPYGDLENCTFLSELAGVVYAGDLKGGSFGEGASVKFQREPTNPKDIHAVQVYCDDIFLGYIKKVHACAVSKAIDNDIPVAAKIHRLVQNGVIRSILLSISIGK
ncbi:HIRAN domain-containing protein [Elusimicrobiota bacterium]